MLSCNLLKFKALMCNLLLSIVGIGVANILVVVVKFLHETLFKLYTWSNKAHTMIV